ncbi:hypothetical protein Csa_018781 [Cucumis sativus]|uniref:Phytosulfokine n=1 Tax=Cucumis sativus TaxID=3659 RepID=A0A0A0LR23_CUCSA|nr:hypothetical protein Csa_018781 [Cucumis sativus]
MSKNLASLTTTIAALATIMSLIIVPSSEGRPIPSFELIPEFATNHNNDGSCEGSGKEDCLIRRTLQAHTDYVYTCDNPTKP